MIDPYSPSKCLCIALFGGLPSILLAQPTLTSGSISFVPGDTYHESSCAWVDPGPSGEDQIWDFSGLSVLGTPTSTWVAPLPWMDLNYADATVSYSYQNYFAIYQASPAALQYLGFVESVSLSGLILDDPADEMRYPFGPNSAYTDAFSGRSYFPAGGQGGIDTVDISGLLVVEGDAYGTLILPWGTVENVIRIHKVRTTIGTSGMTTEEEYRFYEPGIHDPWMRTYRKTVSWAPDVTESARFVTPEGLGFEELRKSGSLSACFVNDHVELMLTSAAGIASAELLAVDGMLVQAWRLNLPPGTQRTSLSVHSWVGGVCLLRVTDQSGATTTTRVPILR